MHTGDHRCAGTPGLPCAMVLTADNALSPATNSFCHRRQRINGQSKTRLGSKDLRQLDTSNGCQDHTALPSAASSTKTLRPAHVLPEEILVKAFKRRSSARCCSLTETALRTHLAPDAAASTASRPNVRDDGQRPSLRDRMGQTDSADLPDGLSGIFLRAGLDRNFGDLPVGSVCRT